MVRRLTRATFIRLWFSVVMLTMAAGTAFGAPMTIATAGKLLALSLLPPVIVVSAWPDLRRRP